MSQFRERQEDLRHRVGRLPMRSLVRRRLERELRGLVREELQRAAAPAPTPEANEENEHALQWWQR